MKAKFFLIFFLLFFVNIVYVSCVDVEININESSSLTKLNNGGYSLVADGIIEIRNPSLVSKIYEFELPLQLDALIGINKIVLDDKPGSGKFLFQYNKIEGYLVEPNETISVGYHIFGLLDYNIYSNLNPGQSVLDYYVKDYNLRGKLILNLQKPQREGFEYNLDGTINKTPIDGNNTRLISSEIRNPTDFNYIINELKIYRTNVSSPFYEEGTVIAKKENLSLAPFDLQLVDFFDRFSSANSVYWMSTDSKIKTNIFFNVLRNYQIQESSGSSGGGSKGSSGGSGFGSFKDKDLSSILLKKDTDKTVIRNNEEFTVILRIVNVNNYDLQNLVLYDEIPDGYEIKDVSESVKIADKKLTFNINKVEAYETKVLEYTLISKKEGFKGITYLKPAVLNFENKDFFSEGVILINDLLPKEKVFVQKEVKYVDENFAQVKIIVKNLGNYKIDNLLVSDFIGDDSIIKDISKMFYEDRGTWLIKTLNSGEEWEVTYLVNRDSKLDSLPNIFGIDKSEVYGTFISSGEVVTIFSESPHTIEKVGMGLAVAFLVLYLLF